MKRVMLMAAMWMPVHLSDHYYDPAREYCGLYIVAKIELPEFGPTTELLKIFDKCGIVLITITSHQKDLVAYDFIIVDLTGKKHMVKELKKEIKKKFGKRLLLFECTNTGIPGFIYNMRGFPLIFNFNDSYLPMAAMSTTVWRSLFEGLMKRFGSGGSVILWFMGNDAGEGKARSLQNLKGNLSNAERIKIALARLQSFGWGKFELIECDDQGKRVVIRVHDNFEDIVTKDIEGYQNSFIRGFLVGFVCTLFNRACRGIETKCINKGDPFCEFLIR
jgi:predicted hydrocarbon binding protein